MAYVRDDIAMREYRQLLAEKADVTRTIEVALRRAREIKRE